jgi:hypothetical protein
MSSLQQKKNIAERWLILKMLNLPYIEHCERLFLKVKEECRELLNSGFFSRIVLPRAPDDPIRAVSNFVISQGTLHLPCQRYRQQIFTARSFQRRQWWTITTTLYHLHAL